MKKLLRKILLELEIPNPVHGVSGSNQISSRWGDSRPNGRKHLGIDIPVNCGTVLKAPANGEVIEASFEDNECGGRIKIDHGGYSTRYCHLQKINVSVGEKVFKGEKIGEVGGEPGTKGAGTSSSGCHLHMEVKKEGTSVNPEDYVNLSLSPKPTSSDTIGRGSRGNPIKTLKCFLKNTKYRTKLDNEKDTDEIGPNTEEAIKELQKDLGVDVNGKITAEMIPLIKDKIQELTLPQRKLIQSCYSS